MRTPILAGNWKMYKTIAEAAAFAEAVKGPLGGHTSVEQVICAPATQLAPLSAALQGTSLKLGAQNMHWEDQGAFTGEVSGPMLKEVCQFVIIGHSERRQHFGETDETVNLKAKAALSHGLTPILCIGESLEQNQAGHTGEVLNRQVKAAFEGISAGQAAGIVVAYEPIWAIGTGIAATPEEANRIIGEVVRAALRHLYGPTADQMRIQYGGSVKVDNAEAIMSQPEIDGALVGGASLKAEDFIRLVEITAAAKQAQG